VERGTSSIRGVDCALRILKSELMLAELALSMWRYVSGEAADVQLKWMTGHIEMSRYYYMRVAAQIQTLDRSLNSFAPSHSASAVSFDSSLLFSDASNADNRHNPVEYKVERTNQARCLSAAFGGADKD